MWAWVAVALAGPQVVRGRWTPGPCPELGPGSPEILAVATAVRRLACDVDLWTRPTPEVQAALGDAVRLRFTRWDRAELATDGRPDAHALAVALGLPEEVELDWPTYIPRWTVDGRPQIGGAYVELRVHRSADRREDDCQH